MVLPRRCPLSFVEVSRPSHGSTIFCIFKPRNSQNGTPTPLPAFLRGGEQPREYYFKHFQAQGLPKWYSHAAARLEVSRPSHGSTILSIFKPKISQNGTPTPLPAFLRGGEQAQQRK